MDVTRWTVLRWGAAAGAVGAAGVGGLALTGDLDRAENAVRRGWPDSGPSESPPAVATGGLETGAFPSPAMNAETKYAVSYPPGSTTDAALPVVLALYGRGGHPLRPFATNDLALAHYQAAVVAAGSPPFAIATVDGGPASYWHKRESGIDPQRMILDEFLPLLAARGLRTERIALHGESMGGYGALLLAQRLGRQRVAAIAANAPAIFRSASETAPGAFDGPEDFAAHDIVAGRAKLTGIPIRIVCGTLDPFYAAVKEFVALRHRPAIQTSFAKAGHSPGYWRSETAAQLTFLAQHLA